ETSMCSVRIVDRAIASWNDPALWNGRAFLTKGSTSMTVQQDIRQTGPFPGFFSSKLADSDPDIAGAIKKELGRQRHEIELIASENIVSRAVLQAQGSVMTNKYAEGYPGRRYYGGCQYVDIAETVAID